MKSKLERIQKSFETFTNLMIPPEGNKSRVEWISWLEGLLKTIRFYEQIDDNKKAERLYKVVKTQMDAFTGSKNIDQLDGLLNETFDGIMNKLETQELDLKEKESMLIRFVLTGFSAKSIAALLNDTQQNINQRKKRLLDKIAHKSPVLMEDISLVLSPK